MKKKYLNENLDDFLYESSEAYKQPEDTQELKSDDNYYHYMNNVDNINTSEFKEMLDDLFQTYASKGMPFEVMKDIIDETLSIIDWEYKDPNEDDE